MWSEYVTGETIDSRIWPRLAAIAERLWSPQDVKDPKSMYQRLDEVSWRLEWLGLTHESNYVPMLRRLAGMEDIRSLRVLADAGLALTALVQALRHERRSPDPDRLASWWAQIDTWRARQCFSYRQSTDVIKPQYAIERLFALTKDRDVYITTEVGQHQMWAAQFFGFEEPHRWMTSGGLGTMGYGLPAAVGVQVAHPDSLVIDIAGDASVQMTMQEMSTAVQHELPIKIFILNNQYMGMVRQWQQLLHGNRLSHSYSEALPDFVKLAEAYGCVGIQAIKPGDLDGAIKEMINVKRPVLFDCRVAALENCFPMIPSGKAHNEMLLPVEATDEATATAFAGGKALV